MDFDPQYIYNRTSASSAEEWSKAWDPDTTNNWEESPEAEQVIRNAVKKLKFSLTYQKMSGEDPELPAYNYKSNLVNLPLRDSFRTAAEFYMTAFHEIVHATGPALQRPVEIPQILVVLTRGAILAEEESVAELGSYVLMHRLGLATEGTDKRSFGYLADWTKRFSDQKELLKLSLKNAEHAADFLLAEE